MFRAHENSLAATKPFEFQERDKGKGGVANHVGTAEHDICFVAESSIKTSAYPPLYWRWLQGKRWICQAQHTHYPTFPCIDRDFHASLQAVILLRYGGPKWRDVLRESGEKKNLLRTMLYTEGRSRAKKKDPTLILTQDQIWSN